MWALCEGGGGIEDVSVQCIGVSRACLTGRPRSLLQRHRCAARAGEQGQQESRCLAPSLITPALLCAPHRVVDCLPDCHLTCSLPTRLHCLVPVTGLATTCLPDCSMIRSTPTRLRYLVPVTGSATTCLPDSSMIRSPPTRLRYLVPVTGLATTCLPDRSMIRSLPTRLHYLVPVAGLATTCLPDCSMIRFHPTRLRFFVSHRVGNYLSTRVGPTGKLTHRGYCQQHSHAAMAKDASDVNKVGREGRGAASS